MIYSKQTGSQTQFVNNNLLAAIQTQAELNTNVPNQY